MRPLSSGSARGPSARHAAACGSLRQPGGAGDAADARVDDGGLSSGQRGGCTAEGGLELLLTFDQLPMAAEGGGELVVASRQQVGGDGAAVARLLKVALGTPHA